MNAVVRFCFSATGAVVALLAAAIWVGRRPQSHAARRFLICAAVAYTLAGTYAVPAIVSRALAPGYHQFTAADVPHGVTALVVLGSGTMTVDGWDESLSLMTDIEAARVLEAWRVFRLTAPAVVISSGGLPDADDFSQPSGQNMRDALVRLGVPDASILVETTSRNTHEQAVIIAPLLRARGIEHVVLVTSDTHMRRSLGAFRAQGWAALPAIAPDPGWSSSWDDWLLPSSRGLELTSEVAHELLGLPYYWCRGWWRS